MTKTKIRTTKKTAATVFAGACAYGATLSAIGGFDQAGATTVREMPSSICHAQYDNNGTLVNNSGALTYTGTGTKSIYCPVVSDNAQWVPNIYGVSVWGQEGTDGASSRTCSCYLDPVVCSCSSGVSWVNNMGQVAAGLSVDEWSFNQREEFRYLLHIMTQNSSLVGMILVGS
jgi:hypothetical protein